MWINFTSFKKFKVISSENSDHILLLSKLSINLLWKQLIKFYSLKKVHKSPMETWNQHNSSEKVNPSL